MLVDFNQFLLPLLDYIDLHWVSLYIIIFSWQLIRPLGKYLRFLYDKLIMIAVTCHLLKLKSCWYFLSNAVRKWNKSNWSSSLSFALEYTHLSLHHIGRQNKRHSITSQNTKVNQYSMEYNCGGVEVIWKWSLYPLSKTTNTKRQYTSVHSYTGKSDGKVNEGSVSSRKSS